MGHFSTEKSLNPGSDLGGNQQLAVSDPTSYLRFNALRDQAQRAIPAIQQAQNRAAEAAAAAFREIAEHEDALFEKRNKISEHDTAGVVSMFIDAGLSVTELEMLYGTAAPISMDNPVTMRIVEYAARFHTGKPLDNKAELWPAIADMLNAAGFSDDDIGAIGNGAPICLRDHRSQQVALWAYRHQQRTRQRP